MPAWFTGTGTWIGGGTALGLKDGVEDIAGESAFNVSGASRDLDGISLHFAGVFGMPLVVGSSVEANGPGETWDGLEEMAVGPVETGLEGRSAEPGNSGGREMIRWSVIAANTGGYWKSTSTSWVYW